MAIQELTRTIPLGTPSERPAADGLDQFAAASGIVGFVLAIGAIVVGATTGTAAANPGSAAADVARAYANVAAPLVWAGAMLQTVALLSLFAFATYFGSALHRDWLGRLAAGAGQTFVGLTLAGFAIGSIARFRAGPNLDLSAAMALFDIHVALYIASWAFGALFMAAAAGLGLRARTLPLWLSIGAAIAALVNLAAVALPTTPLASFPNVLIWLWVLAVSAVLFVRSRRTATPIGR